MIAAAPTRGEKPLALTMGEPAGVGGEITLKAWLRRDEGLPRFFAVDDPERLRRLARRLDLAVPIAPIETPERAAAAFSSGLPVLPQPLAAEAVPGHPDPANAEAVRAAIECAVTLVRSGDAAAVVTNPIQKHCLYQAGFPFPGHTEFLASLAGGGAAAVMMLACAELRAVPVTGHTSLRDAVGALNTERIVEAAAITEAALRRDFGIARPRLAVAGLNPHAGEGGAMGSEEADIIAPAVAALGERGIDAFGPVPPDTLFSPRSRKGYDAAICMYHDQALIPIKTIAFDSAVNITLGLPFIRTSPDHGTAYDIAGTGRGDPTSLIEALNLAAEMVARRAGKPV